MDAVLAQATEKLQPYAVHLHPDVVALIGVLALGYWWTVRRIGPRHAPDPRHPITREQVAWYSAGLVALWVALSWPVHDLGENYLFAFHMLQHLIIMMIAAPLILLGIPGWMMRWVLGPGLPLRVWRAVSRPVPAFALSTFMVILLHVPPVIDLSVRNNLSHVLFHQAMLVIGLIMWMPVLSPMPEIRRINRPLQMLYLFLQSILPTIPTSFLTFSDIPLYDFYTKVPVLWGIGPVDDQRIGGLLMKIVGGMLLWSAIAVIFFVWQADEERGEQNQRRRAAEWDDLVRSFREEVRTP